MFLKKIEIRGFKSFADHMVIHFDDPVTGVVGPNGCGKSNISDAIRWVLGEQSVKSMRGTTMTDVIFNGSETRRRVNLAEVTLVFNNEHKVLNTDFEEVEVTRRLYRDTKESEYLINKTPCRLRDIHDLVMDTGLGRDSLSIISQGSISHFAEARPIDRRLIFEEAAGVAKYKRRKIESINKLERTKENMDRMQDIVDEIDGQRKSLERQAKKATEYLAMKERLETMEVSVLVHDIELAQREMKTLSEAIDVLDSEAIRFETELNVHEHTNESWKKEQFELDQKVNQGQERMMRLMSDISKLEARKIEIEERRKYTIQVGNVEEKARALKEQMQEFYQEYQDRLSRKNSLVAQVDLETQSLNEKTQSMRQLASQAGTLRHQLDQTKHKAASVKSRLDRPFEANQGVQSVMENANALNGIYDVVGKLFTVDTGYEQAITTSLAGAMMHIVTEDDKSAVNAIEFLKRNRSGRATFMPLTTAVHRQVHEDGLMIAKNTTGFLGLAQEFVDVDLKYDALASHFLGNVLVSDTIENANILAKRLRQQYKVVTLDGDVIHKGGLMTGGRAASQQSSMLTLQKEYDALLNTVETLEQQETELNQAYSKAQHEVKLAENAVIEKRLALAQIEPLVEVKEAQYHRAKQDYEHLDFNVDEHESENDTEDETIRDLTTHLMDRDELTNQLSLLRQQRHQLSLNSQRIEGELREIRKEMQSKTQESHALQMKMAASKTKHDSGLERLALEYQLTFEYAKEQALESLDADAKQTVAKLRADMARLGNVNLSAPEEYQEVQERFDFLNKQLNDLLESRQRLLDVIEEMDAIMIEQFKTTFDAINASLNDVFAALFRGGKARLILEDPDDLLNTGVDIDVQPPGKAVQNIRLFSGGEKSLIAIAVLFSILKARHVPLCIFDEVEAALDQANVERLAHYIKEFSKDDTQFIVITHRPGTMAQADVLYGVTMPTKGVSSLLKVRLEEAVEMGEMA